MSTWERARAVAGVLWIALALGPAGLPFRAAAGQPGVATASSVDALHGPSVGNPAPVALADTAPGFVAFRGDEPFDLRPSHRRTDLYAEKWAEMDVALARDAGILTECRLAPDRCPDYAAQLLAIIEAAREKQGRARLGEVNRAINLAIRYQSDVAHYGTPDAWGSPLDTLAAGRGDCEDYAIVKYLALRESGVASEDLRLMVVRDTKRQQDHAVLSARFGGRWLVLDNRRMLLLDDQDLREYEPLAWFGSESPVVIATDSRESPRGPVQPITSDPS